jgi:uncharacterized protein (TIGR02231 family)
MKNIMLSLALLLLGWSLPAQNETTAESKIDAVTVFLQGAQVTRVANVPVKKGKNTIYFRGLGEGINPQSIQVTAPPAFLINSVVHEINYLDQLAESPKVTKLQDSLEILQHLMEDNTLENTTLEQEKTMINRNQAISSKEQGLSIDELQKAADFFRQRLTEILDRQLTLTRKNAKLSERRNAINYQLAELNARRNRPSNDIKLILEAEGNGTAAVDLSYFIAGAGWTPGYKIRAKDTQSPITLEYSADVYQNTGIDWTDVLLTLSSGNPNNGGTQPVLSAWSLYVQEPVEFYGYKAKGKAGAYPAAAPKTAEYESDDMKKSEESADESFGGMADSMVIDWDLEGQTTLSNYTTVQEGATTAEFKISIRQTIKSNGKAEQVSVRSADLPAQFRHYAVPKLDKDAFLVAGLIGWDTLNLLPGNAQIFFEGTYVTEVSIDPAYTKDTLNLSMGRDKKVIIERNQLKDFNKVRVLGVNRERTFGYEIKIRNTKDAPVSLTLEDQIPVSQDKDIEVKLEESSGAKLDPATGKLVWDLQLGKAETKVIKLVYSVKHPKNKFVEGI